MDVSDIQEDITISGNRISGSLKYLSGDNAIVNEWGEGHFIVLNLADNTYTGLTSVKVGMQPSMGSGLVELIADPDKNGVFKVTDDVAQKFMVVSTDGTHTLTQAFDLSGLTLEEPEAEG